MNLTKRIYHQSATLPAAEVILHFTASNFDNQREQLWGVTLVGRRPLEQWKKQRTSWQRQLPEEIRRNSPKRLLYNDVLCVARELLHHSHCEQWALQWFFVWSAFFHALNDLPNARPPRSCFLVKMTHGRIKWTKSWQGPNLYTFVWSLCVAIGMFSTMQVKPGRVSNQEGLNVTSWVKEQICHNLLNIFSYPPGCFRHSARRLVCRSRGWSSQSLRLLRYGRSMSFWLKNAKEWWQLHHNLIKMSN